MVCLWGIETGRFLWYKSDVYPSGGINSAVEGQLPKLKVGGSNPISRSKFRRSEISVATNLCRNRGFPHKPGNGIPLHFIIVPIRQALEEPQAEFRTGYARMLRYGEDHATGNRQFLLASCLPFWLRRISGAFFPRGTPIAFFSSPDWGQSRTSCYPDSLGPMKVPECSVAAVLSGARIPLPLSGIWATPARVSPLRHA